MLRTHVVSHIRSNKSKNARNRETHGKLATTLAAMTFEPSNLPLHRNGLANGQGWFEKG
jgi:hypothetical protein